MRKEILCLDFDGTIHSYSSGWKGIDIIPDPPIPGAFEFIEKASKFFKIEIFSARSAEYSGLKAMENWILKEVKKKYGHIPIWASEIGYPFVKPPAMITIDDRALTFNGDWSSFDVEALKKFQPWNKRRV